MTETTSYTLSKIMRNGVEYRVGGGFINISNVKYKSGKLSSFTADGKDYNLYYKGGQLNKIITGNKIYNVDYANGRLVSTDGD